jgi:integrase
MAKVYKLPKPTRTGMRYEVRHSYYTTDGARRYGRPRFRTRAEADDFALEKRNEAATGLLPTPRKEVKESRRATLSTYAEKWYTRAAMRTTTRTARGYDSILRIHVLPTFGARPVIAITTGEVFDWVAALEAGGLAPPTIRKATDVLRRVLMVAVKEKAIPTNPAVDVELPTDQKHRRLANVHNYLDAGAVERLAQHLDAHPPYGLVVRFMAYTGLRCAEISGLRIADVSLLRREVLVQRTLTRSKITAEPKPNRRNRKLDWDDPHTPKSGKMRRVPLTPDLVRELTAYLEAHPRAAEPDAPLFPGRIKGDVSRLTGGRGSLDWSQPWERDAFYKNFFKPALAATGLPTRVRLHDLRHSYASLCASAGLPSYRVAAYLGHANARITEEIYTGLFNHDAAADMDALGALDRRVSAPNNVVPLRSTGTERS